jgi:hypothetical protein
MNKQLSASQSWHEGANYPSPVQKVLAFGYYDGPTEGVLQCSNGQTYRFDLLAWEPETQDLRLFCLSPLPAPGWEQLTTLCAAREAMRWPVWVVGWHEGLHQSIQESLRQAGPVEWVVATEDLQGEILRVKAIRPDELARVTDWSAFFGLSQELRDSGPHLKVDE